MAKVKVQQATTLTPQQQQLMKLINQGLTQGTGPLADIFGGFNKEEFEKGVSAPMLEDFKNNILPQITEKFIAGGQSLGSGHRTGEIKAGNDFQKQLASLMYQAQQDALKNKMGGINSLLQTKGFENIVQQPKDKSSIWSSVLPAALGAVGTIGGAAIGGPAGAAAGNVAGSTAGKAIAG